MWEVLRPTYFPNVVLTHIEVLTLENLKILYLQGTIIHGYVNCTLSQPLKQAVFYQNSLNSPRLILSQPTSTYRTPTARTQHNTPRLKATNLNCLNMTNRTSPLHTISQLPKLNTTHLVSTYKNGAYLTAAKLP